MKNYLVVFKFKKNHLSDYSTGLQNTTVSGEELPGGEMQLQSLYKEIFGHKSIKVIK